MRGSRCRSIPSAQHRSGWVFNKFLNGCLSVLLVLVMLPVQAATDPTRPPSARSASIGSSASNKPQPWRLQSIRISQQSSRAVINGTQVREGERVRGAKVLSIEPGLVLLQQGSKRIRLTLGGVNKIKRNTQEIN